MKEYQYDPSCAKCRDNAGKNRAGVKDDALCVPHLRAELAALRARCERLEGAARMRLESGHNDTCSYALSADSFNCDCGHLKLKAALEPFKGSTGPGDVKR